MERNFCFYKSKNVLKDRLGPEPHTRETTQEQ